MKFLGIYFTGTGNSKKTMEVIKDNLLSFGHTLDMVDVISKDIKDVKEYDALIIVYPIYAFNTPKPVIQYVKKLSKLDSQKPCLIMKQSGEHLFWNNASSLYLASLLKKRNIKVTNEYHYLMPYSFIFKHTDYMAFRMYNVLQGLIPLDLKDFLDGKENHLKRFFLDRLFAFIFRIQWWGGRFNGLFYKVEKDKCIKCMKCVNECPSNNIKYDVEKGKFKFGYQCLMCQKCVMYCPKNAVKAGMFNAWRVDTPYTFIEAPYQKERYPNYCKKSYIKYFEVSEKRIKESKV